MSKLLIPFSCLLRAPALVALATHHYLKINFKPITVDTGGLFLLMNATFLCYKQLSTVLRYYNYIKGLNNFRPQGSK